MIKVDGIHTEFGENDSDEVILSQFSCLVASLIEKGLTFSQVLDACAYGLRIADYKNDQ